MQMLIIYFTNVILKTGRNHSVAGNFREIQYMTCEVSIFSWRPNSNLLVAYSFIPLCTQSLKTSQHMLNFFNHTNKVYTNTVKPPFFTSAGTISRGRNIKEGGKSKTLKSSILKTCGWHITKRLQRGIWNMDYWTFLQYRSKTRHIYVWFQTPRLGDKICALLGNYAWYNGNSSLAFQDNLRCIDCPKTSVKNYHHTPHNFTEQREFQGTCM
jgi:hypothetical protein